MNKGSLIISGYNIRAVVAFCRWARDHRIPFHIIARTEADPIFLTAFRDRVFLVREYERIALEDICDWITRIREQFSYHEVLVLPSTEYLNRFMLHTRMAIESVGGIVPLVGKALYERISDKYSFAQTCSTFGIAVPEEYPAIPDSFPFVAKPRSYASISKRQLKPYLIHSAIDLARFRQNENTEDYFFQQYIEGKSLYLLASIPRTEKPVLFAQENLIQQAHGGSVILARTDNLHEQRPGLQYLALLAEMLFHGLIMIEVRFNRDTQKYFMIEANPRLWGPIQLVVDNDVDIFGSFLRDYGFVVERLSRPCQCRQFYFWSGGLVDNEEPAYHNYSPDRFVLEFNSISRDNLFLREDTMDLFRHELLQTGRPCAPRSAMSQITLIELYNRTSKHSNYQVLARPLRALIPRGSLNTVSRYEIERLHYILSHCTVNGKVIADVGGNTGFFTIECAAHGASSVLYFEGNETHAEFVREAARALHLDGVIAVSTRYIHFKDDFDRQVDVCFLLNVLHHIGDDYGESAISRHEAKKAILASLSHISGKARLLVFQLGFNWKGDRNLPLFEHGTKAELINFIRDGTADDWEMLSIGVAQRLQGRVEYHELNETNIQRDDRLGEFLNRPLFVMRSRSLHLLSSPAIARGVRTTTDDDIAPKH